MNIVVCIKQTPDVEKVKFNSETRTLLRAEVENIMNPYDEQALEVALEMKDQEGAKVTVISMGLPQANDVLKQALAMGADEAYLITDRALAGSDTFATSLTLANAINKIGGADLVLCGKQAVDGDTAQVGPEIAEMLGMPQITGALHVEYKDEKFFVNREDENCAYTMACPAPLLITVITANKEPRFASIKGKMKARKAVIPTLTAADLGMDESNAGLNGSPTRVIKSFTPDAPAINTEIIKEEDVDVAVNALFEKLVAANLIKR